MKKTAWLNRNFVFLLLGQIMSLLGNGTLKFALAMYVLERTGSAAVFAGMLSASMLPTIALSPFGGVLADRMNRRTLMIALDALSGLAALMAGAALPLGYDLPLITVLLVALSALGAFESPTVQACVPQMLSGDALEKGNAAVSQAAAVASLATPFLGSVVYTAVGMVPVLYAAAACFLLTACLEGFIRLPPPQAAALRSAAMLKADLRAGLRFLCREQPDVLKLLLLAALASLFIAGTAVVGFPFLVRTVLGLSAELYGAAESAMGVAAVLGSLFAGLTAGRLRPVRMVRVFMGVGAALVLAGGAFLVPLDATGRYLGLTAMFCACQFGCSVFSTCAISAIQRRTPEGLMGKVMAYVFTLSLCAQPLGQILYGALFDRCGARAYWVLVPSGLLVCLAGALSRGFLGRLGERG
ncbi:MAG TPA: MFS transporter [Candidatus Limiplasma pullicola]|nr:MFS transporter [Candidatus Limiplasma pullicola]